MQHHLPAAKGGFSNLAEDCKGPSTINIKDLFLPLFFVGKLSNNFLSPHTSSGASQLKLGRVSGGAPPTL